MVRLLPSTLESEKAPNGSGPVAKQRLCRTGRLQQVTPFMDVPLSPVPTPLDQPAAVGSGFPCCVAGWWVGKHRATDSESTWCMLHYMYQLCRAELNSHPYLGGSEKGARAKQNGGKRDESRPDIAWGPFPNG